VQERLLQAALFEPDQALEAWREVRGFFETSPRNGLRRLGPLILENLQSLALEDPILERLRSAEPGRAARAGVRRELLETVVAALRVRGVEVMLVKGAALELQYYKRLGLRPMSDVDVVVPSSRLDDAREAFEGEGWQPRDPAQLEESARTWIHATPFQHPTGLVIDLHWHVLAECLAVADDDLLWSTAVSVPLGRQQVRSLDRPEQLLQTISHGCRWSGVPTFGWIADAATILRAEGQLDWDRVIALAERLRLVPAVKQGLSTFDQICPHLLPEGLLRRIGTLSATLTEEAAFRARTTAPDRRGPVDALALHLDERNRLVRSHTVAGGWRGHLELARRTWGRGTVRRAPARILRGFVPPSRH
jgi:hypothetical protein